MAHEEELAAAMREHGITPPPNIIADGKLHRFPSNGQRGDDAGWYVLHADGIPAGAFGDWRQGIEEKWRACIDRPLTPQEQDEQRERIEAARIEAEQERQRRAANAAALAAAVWKAAKPVCPDHPYLIHKGIKPAATLRELPAMELARRGYVPQAKGEALQGRVLIVPVKSIETSKLATLEFIDEAGRKSALAGGIKRGCYWAPVPLPDAGRVLVAEGVATALSLHEAGFSVVAALSAGNLRPVAEGLRARGLKPVIAADCDKETGETFRVAVDTAEALGLPLVAPRFEARKPNQTDWNDLHVAAGLDAVREQVTKALHRPAVRLESAADLHMEPVRWLWDGWLPRGMLTLLAGAPGCGKTTLAMTIAATVSAGGQWPDGTRCEPGDVVIWSGEDSPSHTLAPRLLAAGADLARVHFITGTPQADGSTRPFDPATDMPHVRQAFDSIRPALLILDPIVSAVAADSHKNAEVRRGLQPIVSLAEATGCAVLGITHTSKGTSGREPWERVTGSLAFAALARVVLFAAVNRADDENLPPRLLARAKSNLGPDAGGVGYDLALAEPVPGIKTSAVQWLDAVQGEARALLAKAERWQDHAEGESELESAKRFLADLLSDGPLPAKTIKADADGAGFAWRTLHRAADALGVEKRKEGGAFGGKGAVWMWYLPQDAKLPTRCQTKKVGTLCDVGILCDAEGEEAL